jgi:hypothetical protein
MLAGLLVALGPAALGAAASGCGSTDPGAGKQDAASERPPLPPGPLLPWQTGNTWTYRVTQASGIASNKVTTVGAAELVGGTGPNAATTAFKVVTSKMDGADETISWQALVGERVVRYREQSFAATGGALELEEHWSPHKLHVDSSMARTAAGATWLEEYQETKLPIGGTPSTATARDRWTVMSPNESVTVPAGTFNAVVLTKAGGTSTKTYWYVPGVGKVKETGGQTEELVSYSLAGGADGGTDGMIVAGGSDAATGSGGSSGSGGATGSGGSSGSGGATGSGGAR